MSSDNLSYFYEEAHNLAAEFDGNIGSLIERRAQTHGDFTRNAEVSQTLKDVLGHHSPEHRLEYTERQRECLDLICTKLSRITSGQASFKDHWDDIAGYAKLAVETDGQESQ